MVNTIQLHNVPSIKIFYPDGRVINDTRPGHSFSGLMYYMDRFQTWSDSLRTSARRLNEYHRAYPGTRDITNVFLPVIS